MSLKIKFISFVYLCNINDGLIDYTHFSPTKLTIPSINILQIGTNNEIIKKTKITEIFNLPNYIENYILPQISWKNH